MAASQITPPLKPWFIGWAFHFKSVELNFDLFGSPFEILRQLKQANIEPKHAASHIATQISATPVHKDGRVSKFSGGPSAPGLIQLLDATAAKEWNAARQVIGQYPTLLTAGDQTASVALCTSASLGQMETVEFLIANGAQVNGAGSLGMTALHWAAVHNQPAIAKMLIDAGADISFKSWFFLTPANLSHANSHVELLAVLAPGNADASKVRVMDVLKEMGCA